MKEITSIELIALNGGAAVAPQYSCMDLLQYEANTHRSTGNRDIEDAYQEDWNVRFNDCVKNELT